ncbi:hypothetical protein [Streptomyces sp. NBC_01022]|uniref:hypothetical protein n=1 Tax=Streptomyces sp. NBC_01022 TaxID=2903723 RepID=UPI002DD8EB09|nr:hypothetical protein [Streptomyces sp. NBC_01022]WRZ83451.1 hypothetical protein OG316_25960 [Streptomyces sp. NBC_01022]
MTTWLHDTFPGHEVNLAFARGLPADAFFEGLREQNREPLARGEANGWAWAVHDMINEEDDDYEEVDYGRLCPRGAEVVVFVTEPCSAKAHGPHFVYYRDGRTTLFFSFEDFRQQRVGDNPDYLSAELFAAGVIGPAAECEEWKDGAHDCYEHEDADELRLVRAIVDAFGLPSPPLAALPLAPSPRGEPPVATGPVGAEPVGAVSESRPVVAPGTYAVHARGVDVAELAAACADAGYPARTQGESGSWAWVTWDAAAVRGGEVSQLAGFLTGFRYDERFGGPDRVETVFLAGTPACACANGQNYGIQHCEDHPFQFLNSRGGFGQTYFNVGRGRETQRHGDLLIRELLAAGIVGRDTSAYDADPDFNADGAVTMRIIAGHFGLPATT